MSMEHESILSLIHFMGMAFLIFSFAMIASPQLLSCVRFYALHSLSLAVITALIAYGNHVEHLIVPAILTLVLKTWVIPQIFFKLTRRLGVHREIESYINIPFSLVLSTLLVFAAYYTTGDLKVLRPVFSNEFIPLAIATILIGMLMMATRKNAVSQVLGLLLLENGLFLMAVTMTFGMPLLVELGIFFDVLVGAIIMGIFVFKIRNAFEGIDVDDLTVLKG
ncbi:MAG: formate hydrogenlyase [Candidatus Omnitrophica bacterium]|nr:formate hydrogenlyase [Candidatus Omnitrophota bacterium]